MNKSNEENSFLLALAIVEQLVDSGITHMVASPGFRNAPLVLAADLDPRLIVYSSVEERGAGFLALGLAKAGKLTALLCTSGTAVANYFPAVMEAHHSHCPLIILTADRPSELVGTGANQCTDQIRVFGNHARFFAEIDGGIFLENWQNIAKFSVARAVGAAQHPVPGPSHLNIRFREPFLPKEDPILRLAEERAKEKKISWKLLPSAFGPSESQWKAMEPLLRAAGKMLFLLGPGHHPAPLLKALLSFSKKSGVPILAENASGLAFFEGGKIGSVLKHPEMIISLMLENKISCPDLILRIGAPPTGKGLAKLLAKKNIPQIIFEQVSEAREPNHHPSTIVQGGCEGWLHALNNSGILLEDTRWAASLGEKCVLFEEKIAHYLESEKWTEWLFHRTLERKILSNSVIFLGNSMPIRDFNSVFPETTKNLSIFTNRGLSGIDGLISSAAGIALAEQKPTHAIIGDLSMIHDLSSFSILNHLKDQMNLNLWVLNNSGGEIFRMVPTAQASKREDIFTTPRFFDLESLAKGFSLPHRKINNLDQWNQLKVSGDMGVRIFEIVPDPAWNTKIRKDFSL